MRRREAVLDFVRWYIEKRGYPPTLREIADAVGLRSVSCAWYHLFQLHKQFKVEWEYGKVRTLRVLE